jgi:ATP-dependent Clp protease ATP-binding subunit ClpC
MVLVERAVRPVSATVARKRQMREELLAHVTGIYEEEKEKSRDDEIALERTRQRFGDPRELSTELQQSVPAWNRLRGSLQEPCARLTLGVSTLQLAAIIAVGTVIVYSIVVLPMVLVMLAAGKSLDIAIALHVMPVTAAVGAVFAFLLVLFGSKISRALYGNHSERRVRRAIYWCLASLPIFPMLVISLYWGFGLPVPNSPLVLAFAIAPATPVLLILMARATADEVRRDEKWTRLVIEQ